MKNLVSFVSATPDDDDVAAGAVIDVSKCAGKIYIGVASSFTEGTTPAVSATEVQTCATSDGTFAAVSSSSSDGTTIIVDQRDCLKYIRVALTVTGSPTAVAIATGAAAKVKAR